MVAKTPPEPVEIEAKGLGGKATTKKAAGAWLARPVNCAGCGAPVKRGKDCAHCGRQE